MCIVESTDRGATWTQPKVLNFHAEPATSFQMDDGRIIVAYGHREEPYGVRLRVSNSELDNLESAEEERDKAVRAIEADIKEEFDSEEAFQILSIIYKHL